MQLSRLYNKRVQNEANGNPKSSSVRMSRRLAEGRNRKWWPMIKAANVKVD